ncbi:hypothetical protein [Flaviflexus massiliensis]|uniref:hypothetical protein n=1 Tax=Flaviflexus massiliensis TaxID=1522309 RepID=UPI0006D575BB|nr:hypothetical protein [Flaviflexus massiliensis]
MSNNIEARAHHQELHVSDYPVTTSHAQFQAFFSFLIVMNVIALGGIGFGAPVLSIFAGIISVTTAVSLALRNQRRRSSL